MTKNIFHRTIMLIIFIIGILGANLPIQVEAVYPGKAFSADAPAAGLVTYMKLIPEIVDVGSNEDVQIWVQTDGTVASAEVEHRNGSIYPLTDFGSGLFGTTLTHTQVLYNYADSDFPNVNRFGYINLYDSGSTQVLHGHLSVGIYDEQIPDVTVSVISSDLQASPHLVNIVQSFTDPAQINQAAIAQRFYQTYGDDYDFLNIISTPMYFGNRYHYQVSNAVTGIGLSTFDDTALYGSSGRLLGITRYPIPIAYYDAAESTMPHETGHQWINFLSGVPDLLGYSPHWPYSELARSIMGTSAPGGQGLKFPWDLIPLGNGDYQLQYNTAADDLFTQMDLYLMGLAAPQEAGSYVVFQDQNQNLCDGCTLQGPVNTVDVQDVINTYGTRSPAYPNAQSHFRMASIIVSQQMLTNREMAYYDYFSRRGSAPIPIDGLRPWADATQMRSSLSFGLGGNCSDSNTVSPRFYSHTTPPGTPIVNQNLTFLANIHNASSNHAYQVTFFDDLPGNVEFVSASVGGDSSVCSGTDLILCTLDVLYAGESATIAVTVKPQQTGDLTHTVGLASCGKDEFLTDNRSDLTVTVSSEPPLGSHKVYLPNLKK